MSMRYRRLCLVMLSSFCLAQPAFSPKTQPAQITTRFNEARELQEKGLFPEARRLFESLLPALRAEGDSTDLARALNALSQIASAEGDYDTAIARARESADVFRKLGDKIGEARAVNNRGVAELFRADYSGAMDRFQRALALYRSAGHPEGEIEQLNNIGNVFYFQGKYLDALRSYQSAMDRVSQTAREPWNPRRRQINVSNLATVYQRLGRFELALELYRQLEASPQALSPSEQARLLANMGAMYRRLGDPLKALDTYRSAQRLFAHEPHKDGEIGVLKNIGIALALDMSDLSGALEAFTNALQLAERTHNRREAMQTELYRGEALYRLNRPEGARKEFEAALIIANELDTAEEQWKALYGLGRSAARAGADDLAVGYFRQAIARIESVRSQLQFSALRSEFLADKRDVYDALIELLLGRKPDTAELFNLMERSRARTFQDRLEESTRRDPPTSARALTLEAIQRRLDDSTLLLEFWATPQNIAVVWVTRQGSGIAQRHLSPADLDEISAFLRDVSTRSGDEWQAYSQRLGDLLLSGVEPLTRPRLRHLLIVPDGILNSVPFELLRTGAGQSSLLVERFDISYLPSAVILLRHSEAGSKSWAFPWSRQLVAFGDPLASGRSSRSLREALPGEERARLPKSAEEVEAIARLSRGRAELFLGPADLKRYLLQGKAKGASLVHLSTHATADVDNPERSRILFSPEHVDEAADYLFLKELYELDLDGVDLATLSACDTERGKMIRGEGVQAFSRALLAAGARATVTTLWRVADQPTAEFMKQFYYALSQGKPKAEALRLAKLKLMRSGSALHHPRHWAAFVLNGDGLRPVPRVLSWSALLLPIAGILFVLGVAVRRGASGSKHC